MRHLLSEIFNPPSGADSVGIIAGSYEPVAVALSVIIAILASYTALSFANRMAWGEQRRRSLWLLLGAGTMGVGIWSMHFVGMLAYELPITVRYDPYVTVFSMLPSAVASWLAFSMVGRKNVAPIALIGAALFMGLAIAVMHYVGMTAMVMPAFVSYDPYLFGVSVFIAVAASWGALRLTMRFHNLRYPPEWKKQLSAVLMGIAVSGMHYTGMAAMRVYDICLVPPDYTGAVDLGEYDWLIALLTLVFLLVMVLQAVHDRFSSRSLSLAAKTTLMASVLVMFAAASVGAISYFFTHDLAIGDEVQKIEREVRDEIGKLDRTIKRLKEDVNYLHGHPRLRQLADNRGYLDVAGLQGKDGLALIFREMLHARPNYQQIRLVGVADGGRELLRVENRNGTALRVPDSALQRKQHEGYFNSVVSSQVGGVYLSDVSFNREHGAVSQPPTRILRAARLVVDADGNRLGFLIINLNLDAVLREMIRTETPDDADHITNEHGEILMARDQNIPITTSGARPPLLYEVYPILETVYKKNDPVGRFHYKDPLHVVDLQKLYYDANNPQRYIAISEVVPMSEIERRVQPVLDRLFLTTLLLTILAAWPVTLLVRMIVRPLNQITEASAQLAAGEKLPALDLERGDEIGMLARTFNDMAGQVKARERELSASEELTRKVIQSAGDAIVIINGRGVIQSVNDSTVSMFGYRKSEMEGSNVSMLMPEPHSSRHDAYLRRHAEAGRSVALGTVRELRGRRRDGETFALELVTTEVVHDNGRLFVGMMRDISGRKQIEQELRLAGQVMEASQESIVITDAARKICAVNPAFTEISGYAPEEALGRNPKFLASGRHDKAFYKAMWKKIHADGRWQGEIWDRRKNGDVFPKWLSISAIRDAGNKVTHYVGIASDITERKLSENRLEQLAHYDALTALPNRLLLQDRLRHGINQCKRDNSSLALLFVDLDRFKSVNDNYGHEVGDQLLVAVATRLKTCIRDGDTLARQGGDEFVVIASDIKDSSDASKIAEHLITALSVPISVDGKECFVGASVGIAIYPDDGEEPDELARKADSAMYRAKGDGGGSYSLYDQGLGEESQRRMQLENALRYAVERSQLELHYQPVVSARDGSFVAVESLMRWHGEDIGQVSPAEFIPLAEDTGLIDGITRWSLRQACQQFVRWRDQDGITLDRIAVNISPRCLTQPDLPEFIEGLLKGFGVPPECLELELTETTLMAHSEVEKRFFDFIERIGVRLAIDDFGTGYSSLAYIKRLPIHTLKIDRSFVRDISEDADDREIIKGVIALAHGLELGVVAEGVETQEQLDFLRDLGCDLIQGWLYMAAVPGDDISDLFRDSDRGVIIPSH